jgi:hypothetical protein
VGSTASSRGRPVRTAVAVVLLVLGLAACGMPGGGGPGTVRVVAVDDPVAVLGPPSGSPPVYHGTFRLFVTNESETDYDGTDVNLGEEGLDWALLVVGGSCFDNGVAAGLSCQIEGAIEAPASAAPQETDTFTAIVSLGATSGSVSMTAVIIQNEP